MIGLVVEVVGQKGQHPAIGGGFVVVHEGVQHGHPRPPVVVAGRPEEAEIGIGGVADLALEGPIDPLLGLQLQAGVVESVGQGHQPLDVVGGPLPVGVRRASPEPGGVAAQLRVDGLRIAGESIPLQLQLLQQPAVGADGTQGQRHEEGEILLVNKPYKWTSFDVISKIRAHIRSQLGLKKLKVGHAGTLDPLATGIVIVCTGKLTKRINEFQDHIKEYTGTFYIGATTPSYDLEKEIDFTFDTSHLTEELIYNAAKELTGDFDQMPPAFSAKKVNGKRAYEFARYKRSCYFG